MRSEAFIHVMDWQTVHCTGGADRWRFPDFIRKGTGTHRRGDYGQGTVTAIDARGNIRPLTRREPIHAGDMLVTETASAVQVRMLDDAQYSFNAPTRFTFNTYVFDEDDASAHTALMLLERGCFRSISGSIGHQDMDVFRIDTRAGWIGINGTVHSACFDGTVLTTATLQGGTTVSNEHGSVSLGINANFDFSETSVGNAPAGVLAEPAIFRGTPTNQLQPSAPAGSTRNSGPPQLFNPPTPAANPSPLQPQQEYDIIP
jgi:hypothetical protein